MGSLLTFARAYALPLAVGGLCLAVSLCIRERDSRIRAEGAEQVYAEQFVASLENVRTAHDSLTKVLEKADRDEAEIAALRARADSLQRVAEAAAHQASIRATRAGDSLTATLDSLARVVPPTLEPLVTAAQEQGRVQSASIADRLSTKNQQILQLGRTVAHADSTTRIWERRYGALEEAYEARGRALEDAEGVVGVRGQASGPGLFSRTVAVLGSMATGAVLWAAFGP